MNKSVAEVEALNETIHKTLIKTRCSICNKEFDFHVFNDETDIFFEATIKRITAICPKYRKKINDNKSK